MDPGFPETGFPEAGFLALEKQMALRFLAFGWIAAESLMALFAP